MKRISLEDIIHSHKMKLTSEKLSCECVQDEVKESVFKKNSSSAPIPVLSLPYKLQYQYIKSLMEDGLIKPVKSYGTNGKSPALYKEYWLLELQKDYGELKEELLYQLVPEISIDYYLSHLETYEQDRKWVLLLNKYLKEEKNQLQYPKSMNERSFEIWQREKFLSKEQGKKILKRCQIDIKNLNIYETTEPLAYYSHTRKTPQNILIVENKDTFFSMRRHLMMQEKNEILGLFFGTLIYGAGKSIFKSFQDFAFCVEPYMTAQDNQLYYFGDLDYEGIGIYENFAQMFGSEREIKPFTEGYEVMIRKAEKIGQLPDMKIGQNKHIGELFFSYFSEEVVVKMKKILDGGRYIPQEILNITDF